jgi:hypothetical protein
MSDSSPHPSYGTGYSWSASLKHLRSRVEGMHYVCFHYQFEPAGDHDEECTAPGCPAALVGPAVLADPIRDAPAARALAARTTDL